MDLSTCLIILGALVVLVGAVSYAKETIKGNTKPNRVTWLMWTVAPMIAAAAAFSSGTRWAAFPVFIAGFGPLLVFIASFVNPKSYWKLEKFDYLCGFCSALALALWALTREPVVAIILAILSDGFAAIPTLVKSWRYPETETVDAFVAGLFSAITSFFAIKSWGIAEVAFPIYLVILDLGLIVLIARSRFAKHKSVKIRR